MRHLVWWSPSHACSFSFTLFSAHPVRSARPASLPACLPSSLPRSLPARVWCNPLQRAVNPCLHKLYRSILRLDGAAASTFTVGTNLDDIKLRPLLCYAAADRAAPRLGRAKVKLLLTSTTKTCPQKTTRPPPSRLTMKNEASASVYQSCCDIPCMENP